MGFTMVYPSKTTLGLPYGFLGMVTPHGTDVPWYKIYHGTSVPCGVTIPKKPYGIPRVVLLWYTMVYNNYLPYNTTW